MLRTKWREEGNYSYICEQFKSMRQDLTVKIDGITAYCEKDVLINDYSRYKEFVRNLLFEYMKPMQELH